MPADNDLGRLAPGCKADFFTVALDHPLMQPLRDPLRNLKHTAAERVVRDLYVGGDRMVSDGRVTTLDYPFNVARLTDLSKRCAERIPDYDPLRRTAEELMPLSLKARYCEGADPGKPGSVGEYRDHRAYQASQASRDRSGQSGQLGQPENQYSPT